MDRTYFNGILELKVVLQPWDGNAGILVRPGDPGSSFGGTSWLFPGGELISRHPEEGKVARSVSSLSPTDPLLRGLLTDSQRFSPGAQRKLRYLSPWEIPAEGKMYGSDYKTAKTPMVIPKGIRPISAPPLWSSGAASYIDHYNGITFTGHWMTMTVVKGLRATVCEPVCPSLKPFLITDDS